jgi:hypothetical protein
MTTIHIVTDGCYSDYGIRAKAEEMAGSVCQACDLLGEAVKGPRQ